MRAASRVRWVGAGDVGVGQLRDFPGGIAGKQTKKTVLAEMRAFFFECRPPAACNLVFREY
ncbi:MAG: hypothetical protein EAZ28_07735 [Oscillatoriales cyanobacterium]|nr:MAG: hypothetical protein EAZ28_07735 [Oscillatoriales cyanobacterium]